MLFKGNLGYRFILIGWIIACGYVFYLFIQDSSLAIDSEVSTLFYLRMLALTFPIGYVAALIAGGLFELMGTLGLDLQSVNAQRFMTGIAWIFMFAAGAFQWFWLIPRALVETRKRLARRK